MPFDGFTIRALCTELNQDLNGARIDKIHQPEKDELVLTIRMQRGGSRRLRLSANPRWASMHLTDTRKPNPPHPSNFCMLLRKHLEGGKIQSVSQVGFERMVNIEIEALDEFREWTTRHLVCEFMGRHSNIIFVNPANQIIIDAIKKYGSELSSYREVLPGRTYVTPPSQDKLNPEECSYEDFCDGIWAADDGAMLKTALFSLYSGVSPFTAQEICLMAGIDPDLPAAQCGEYELGKLYQQVKNLLEEVSTGLTRPTVVYKDNLPIEFAAYPISTATHNFDSMNATCDHYFTAKLDRLRLESWRTNLSRNIKLALDKAHKKYFFQEGDLGQARKQEKYKKWGELITAYSYQLERGMTEAVLLDYEDGEEVTIPLDVRFTPIINAQRYYKIYNKSRKAITHLQKLMAQNRLEIDYLESVLYSIQQAENISDMEEISLELGKTKGSKSTKKSRPGAKTEPSQPRRFESSQGLDILVGRNNRQNDHLTLKQAEPGDLWLHAKNIPGSHVIVRLPRHLKSIHEVPDATLEEAALLAAHFSKASQSEKVEIDYTFRSQVKKPSGAKPGMVIYDNYWTIIVNPNQPRLKNLLENPGV